MKLSTPSTGFMDGAGFLKARPMAVVLDESQRIKNPNSKATEAIHAIGPLAKRRFIITGTPIANCPQDDLGAGVLS
jgi:SNF2 family DNA or RNA helicase